MPDVLDNHGTDNKPIRLIDVFSTIDSSSRGRVCFRPGSEQGWDFHVISHTWSMDVRNLSETVGKRVKKEKVCSSTTYNKAFEEADFSSEPCYKKLIEFLQLLVSEGVKLVWFDALCINQVDRSEKDREVGYMGEYYGRSTGCYVITHGLGKGFRLLAEHGSLPRWFSRGWTFQEFMLPKRLTFIVQDLDPRLIAFINRQVAQNGKKGLCKCVTKRLSDKDTKGFFWGSASNMIWWSFRKALSPSMFIDLDSECGTIDLITTDVRCSQCNSLPFIRKVDMSVEENASSTGLYFVDREAYLGVFQFEGIYLPQENNPFPQNVFADGHKGVEKLMSMYTMLSKRLLEQTWTARYPILEVRGRDFLIEEDRVLAILNLLGVQLSQLRTGKGLKEQMLQLSKVCSVEMMAELCIMDAKPNCTRGMSWMPDFSSICSCETNHSVYTSGSYTWESTNMQPDRYEINVEVEKLDVSDIGGIKLSARVLSGVVLPVSGLSEQLRESETFKDLYLDGTDPPTYFMVVPVLHRTNNTSGYEQQGTPLTPSSFASFSLEWCLFYPLDLNSSKSSNSNYLFLDFKFNYRATDFSHIGNFQVPISCDNNMSNMKDLCVSFPVQLVILGAGQKSRSGGLLRRLVMVCTYVDDGREELHKIGMMGYAEQGDQQDSEEEITFKNGNKNTCLVGGYGPDLSAVLYHPI